ncbi:hypothetical protein [Streptomyces sp. NPDC058665]|uniref:hypothetical protein n=1 Tax=Streptomyces sp. NPDC058665 TaxID=3346586 RepID=UPI00365B51B9
METPDWYTPFEHTPHGTEWPLMFVRSRAVAEHPAGSRRDRSAGAPPSRRRCGRWYGGR